MTRADRKFKKWGMPLLQTHLCRAEPFDSISDKEYFAKELARLEHAYDRKLHARKTLTRLVKNKDILRAARAEAEKFKTRQNRKLATVDQQYDAWSEVKKRFRETTLRRASYEDADYF